MQIKVQNNCRQYHHNIQGFKLKDKAIQPLNAKFWKIVCSVDTNTNTIAKPRVRHKHTTYFSSPPFEKQARILLLRSVAFRAPESNVLSIKNTAHQEPKIHLGSLMHSDAGVRELPLLWRYSNIANRVAFKNNCSPIWTSGAKKLI